MDLDGFLKRIGTTQKDLAEEIGTTPANVSRWSSGIGVPGFDLCRKLLEAGMTTKELFGVEAPAGASEGDLQRKVKKIIIDALQQSM